MTLEQFASWCARPEWPQARAIFLAHGCDLDWLDRLIAETRRNVWRDLSKPGD